MVAPAALEPDDFHFSSMETTEEVTRYAPGGYHPVILGNILGPSEPSKKAPEHYRIVHKLGFGSYGTVWLAQTTTSVRKFVAVKVATADVSLEKEATMHAAASAEHHPNVVTLLDQFIIHGPNGAHSVLVTDVAAPILSLSPSKYSPRWRKTVAHGLAKAVAHIHAVNIVHGDLHLGNVGLALPQMAQEDPHDVLMDLPSHELTVVLPTNPVDQTASLPAYLVAPVSLGAYYDKLAGSDEPQTKIFDFGSAHRPGALPLAFTCALPACSPEIIFARVVEKIENPQIESPADVWALGTAIYEIMTGTSLFNVGMTSLPHRMVSLTNVLPPSWQKWWNSEPRRQPSVNHDSWWRACRDNLQKGCSDEKDADVLVELLKKIFVLDPKARATAADIVEDPWFRNLEPSQSQR